MKKVIGSIIIVAIIGIIAYTAYNMYQEMNIKNYSMQENTPKIEISERLSNKNELQIKQAQSLNLLPEEYKGYKVAAKLEIKKLNIDTYVLEDYSKESMEVSIAKYFGPNANEIGNFCIAGHNYIRKNMFSELGKLNVGDTFNLTDNWYGKTNYEIYDKYKAKPEEVQALSQKTGGKKEVTLITCSDYSKKRIIIKARKKYE